eukprot:gene14535-17170_t
MQNRKKWYTGLRARVALKEAIIVSVSSIWIFIPTGFNPNTLLLVPVFIVIIACNVSVWPSILNGAVVVYATGISSIFLLIVFRVCPSSGPLYWTTIIPVFFSSYIVACIATTPGHRWFNPLVLKKFLIDISILLYFSPVHDRDTQIIENFVISMFIFVSIFVVGLCASPTLATRLFMKKAIKTINSTRIFFRGVGYSMEASVIKQDDSVNMVKNNSFSFPMFPYPDEFDDDEATVEEEPIGLSPEIVLPPAKDTDIQDLKSVGQLPLSRSGAIEKEMFTTTAIVEKKKKKKKKLEYISTSVPLPTEHDLYLMEVKLTHEIDRLTSLLRESRQERWNTSLIGSFDKVLSMLEMNQKQLITIKLAVSHGFSRMATQEVILPMLPFLNSIIEEVYLQMGLMIEILTGDVTPEDLRHMGQVIQQPSSSSPSGGDPVVIPPTLTSEKSLHQLTKSILQASFEETEALVDECKNTYKNIVKEYQRTNLPTLPAAEITKVHYFIFGIMTFALHQREFSNVVFQIKKDVRKCSVQVEILRYGLLYLATSFPYFIINRTKRIYNYIISKPIIDPVTDKPVPKRRVVLGHIRDLTAYLYMVFWQNNKWKFPIQLTIAFTVACAAFYHFQGQHHGVLVINGLWVCATVALVMSPSLGATMTRGFHRMIGTVLGAILGFLIALAVKEVPVPAKEIILMVVALIWIFMVSYVQQDPHYSYAGAVAGLTYLIIAFGQYFEPHFIYTYAVMRAFHITLGVLWVLIVSAVFFPYHTYKTTRLALFKLANDMANTYVDIIELGLSSNISETDMTQRKKAISASLRGIRVSLFAQKGLLLDIRSELVLRPKTKFQHYANIMDHITKAYTQDMNIQIKNTTQELRTLMFNQSRLPEDAEMRTLTECLGSLDTSFQAVRHDLLQRKTLVNLHPEMIQFGSDYYITIDMEYNSKLREFTGKIVDEEKVGIVYVVSYPSTMGSDSVRHLSLIFDIQGESTDRSIIGLEVHLGLAPGTTTRRCYWAWADELFDKFIEEECDGSLVWGSSANCHAYIAYLVKYTVLTTSG